MRPGLPNRKYELRFSLVWASVFLPHVAVLGLEVATSPLWICPEVAMVLLFLQSQGSPRQGRAGSCFWSPWSDMQLLHSEKQKGEDESDEDLDDEAMMALDKNISALFAEQQKRIQAKKDERDRIRKEKILRRDFKIKVWDLCLVQRPSVNYHAGCSLQQATSYLTLVMMCLSVNKHTKSLL